MGPGEWERGLRKLWLSLTLLNWFSRVVSFNSLQTTSKGRFLFMRNCSAGGNAILTLFFPQNCYDIFHLWAAVMFLSRCVQLLLPVMCLCLLAFFFLLRPSLQSGVGSPCGQGLTWSSGVHQPSNMCIVLIEGSPSIHQHVYHAYLPFYIVRDTKK